MANVNTIQISISLSGSENVQHNLEKITGSMQSMGSQAVSLAKDFLYLYGAVKAFQALGSVFSAGFQFSKEMETAKLGIASIISATQDLITKEGVRLTGIEKLNQAQIIARDLMREIQIAGLQTTATTEELVTGFQALLGPASAAGFTLQQTKDITVMMVQAMGALGISMNQLSAEGRSLLDGSIVPTQDRLAVALGITGEMVKKWKEQGVLFEELQKRLEPFKLAGVELANTWSGLSSNMKEAVAYIGSQVTSGIFENLKAGWKILLDGLIDFKNFDVGENIKNIISFINTIATDFGVELKNTFQFVVELIGQINSYLKIQKDQFGGIWDNIKGCVKEVVILIGQVISFGASLAKVSVETGQIQGSLKLIQIALAGINDIVGFLKLGFLTVAWAISGTVLNSIAAVLNLLGQGANWIKNGWGDELIKISQQYYGITSSIEKEMLKTGDQYKNGLLPNLQRVLLKQKNIEESLEKQNNTTKSIVGNVKSLNFEKEKIKSHADDIAKIMEDLAYRKEMIGKNSMQKELLMLDKKHNEEIIKLIEYNASQNQLEEALYIQKLEWIEKYTDLERKQNETILKEKEKLYNQLLETEKNIKKERQNLYENAFEGLISLTNVIGGDFGKVGSELKNIFDINAGYDFYSQELAKFTEYYENRLMILDQMKAEESLIISEWNSYQLLQEELLQAQKAKLIGSYLGTVAGMMNSLYILTGRQNEALFYISKAFTAGETAMKTHEMAIAGAAALARIPIVGPALAVAWMATAYAMGAAAVAAILAQKPGGKMSGGIRSGGGGFSYAQPNIQSLGKNDDQKSIKTPSIQIHVYGNVVDHDTFARELVPSLTKAFEDGVK